MLIVRRTLAIIVSALVASAAWADASVTLVAVGDVMLGRGVAEVAAEKGWDYIFEATREQITAADLVFCNLECPLTAHGVPVAKPISFKAPPEVAGALRRAGFDIVSVANNHTLDCGRSGLTDTLEALAQNALVAVGAGETQHHARVPVVVPANDLRIAFLAACAYKPEGIIYREDALFIALLNPAELESRVRAVAREADVIVVSLHWGIEYTKQPSEGQRRLARRLIDAGASLVLGHHPHTVQPVERYHAGLIAYSLGNFVFDSSREHGRHGIILHCTLGKDGVRDFGVTPVEITDGQPRVTAR